MSGESEIIDDPFGGEYTDFNYFQEGKYQSPEDAFRTRLRDALDKIQTLVGSFEDIYHIESLALQMPHMIYKNTIAFILGYLSIEDGAINIKKFSNAVALSSSFENDNINPEDILRYARFINMNLKNTSLN